MDGELSRPRLGENASLGFERRSAALAARATPSSLNAGTPQFRHNNLQSIRITFVQESRTSGAGQGLWLGRGVRAGHCARPLSLQADSDHGCSYHFWIVCCAMTRHVSFSLGFPASHEARANLAFRSSLSGGCLTPQRHGKASLVRESLK